MILRMLGGVRLLAGVAILGGSASTLGCGESKATHGAKNGAAGVGGGAGSGAVPSTGGMPAAGAGGAGAAAGAPTGGAPPVDPETTRAYSWEECGRIPSSAADGSAQYAADGTLALALGGERLVLRAADDDRRIVADFPFGSSRFAISNDATLLAEPADGGVRLRSLPDGDEIDFLSGPAEGCPSEALRFSLSADKVMTYGESGLCAWRVSDGTLLTRLAEASYSAAFDDDAIVVASLPPEDTTGTPIVARFDLTGAELARFPLALSSDGYPPVLSPDGASLVTLLAAIGERVIGLLRSSDGELIWSRSGDDCSGDPVFSPEGAFLVMGCTFRVSDGSLVWAPPDHASGWRPLALSPTGDEATGPFDYHLATLRQDDGLPRSWSGHWRDDTPSPVHPMRSLAITPDGSRLVSLGDDGLSWDLAPRFEDSVPRTGLLTPYLSRVEVSVDGRWASFAGDGRVVQSLEGEGTVYTAVPDGNIPECIWMQLRFSPDGQWLVGNSYASALNSYRVSDFPAFLGSTLEPTWSSGESGCPTLGSLPSGYPSPIEADGDASRWPSFTGASSLEPFDSGGRHPYDDLAYSPDGQNSVMTLRCEAEGTDGQCEARLSSQRWDESNVPPTLSQFPSFDPTSHWIVAGSTLVHVPSGDVRELNPDAAVALFAPNGDIFVGERDSSLVRYCRTPAAP